MSGVANAPLRVLVVEDEALVAMLLEDMILDAGHQVVCILSQMDAALTYVEGNAESFDLAVLDVNLTGQASFPIAERLAANGKPFVFSTGYGRDGLPEAWRDRPVLTKPFGASAVSKVLQDCLKDPAPRN
jgi:CheY-like chemotaxis protein